MFDMSFAICPGALLPRHCDLPFLFPNHVSLWVGGGSSQVFVRYFLAGWGGGFSVHPPAISGTVAHQCDSEF